MAVSHVEDLIERFQVEDCRRDWKMLGRKKIRIARRSTPDLSTGAECSKIGPIKTWVAAVTVWR